jgi:lathosterol oxidase
MSSFLNTPFTEPFYFLLLTGIIFLVTFLRYVFVSGVYHYFFHIWFRSSFLKRLINPLALDQKQARMEIWRSFLTSLIFAFSGTAFVILWQNGYTKLYTEWSAFPWWYHPLSIILVLLIQETYYYWLHRWMHRPKIYRLVHKWHHDSIKTSALTAFSFHPIESVLQAIVLPLLILILPVHLYLLFALLILMTFSSTINHAGVEVFPRGFANHWLGRWLVGATHHDLHHKEFRYNFGLYFTFWDKWMETESPKFEKQFQEYTDF